MSQAMEIMYAWFICVHVYGWLVDPEVFIMLRQEVCSESSPVPFTSCDCLACTPGPSEMSVVLTGQGPRQEDEGEITLRGACCISMWAESPCKWQQAVIPHQIIICPLCCFLQIFFF